MRYNRHVKRRRRIAAALASLGLLLAGCGDGGSGTTGQKTEQKTDQPAKKKPDPAADRARAERINLTLADLGPGWTIDTSEEPGDAESGKAFDDAFDKALEAKGFEPSESRAVDVDSPDFVKGEERSAFSTTSVYEEEGDAREEFSLSRDPDFLTAVSNGFNEGIQAGLAEDPETRGVTASPIAFTAVPFPVLGQETVAFKGSTALRYSEARITVHFHAVGIRHDRAVALLLVSQQGRQEYPQAEL